MAIVSKPAVTDEVTEQHLILLTRIKRGDFRDGNHALQQLAASMLEAASSALAPPVLSSLEPATTPIGVPPFTLHVRGTGFDEGSVIVFNGNDEPTKVVSETELTTGINMAVWTAPSAPLPVVVRSRDRGLSNELTFTFTEAEAPVVAGAQRTPDDRSPEVRERQERERADRERADRGRDRDDRDRDDRDRDDRDRDGRVIPRTPDRPGASPAR